MSDEFWERLLKASFVVVMLGFAAIMGLLPILMVLTAFGILK